MERRSRNDEGEPLCAIGAIEAQNTIAVLLVRTGGIKVIAGVREHRSGEETYNVNES